MARPTLFSEKLADRICDLVSTHSCGLAALCDEHDELPDPATIYRWKASRPAFCEQFAHAMDLRAELLVAETVEIADDGKNDWMERHGQDSVGWQINGEHVQRSRLRVDTRLKVAELLAPKKYGTKHMAVAHSGSIAITNTTDDELMAELLELVASGRLILPGGIEVAELDDAEAEDDFSDIC